MKNVHYQVTKHGHTTIIIIQPRYYIFQKKKSYECECFHDCNWRHILNTRIIKQITEISLIHWISIPSIPMSNCLFYFITIKINGQDKTCRITSTSTFIFILVCQSNILCFCDCNQRGVLAGIGGKCFTHKKSEGKKNQDHICHEKSRQLFQAPGIWRQLPQSKHTEPLNDQRS